MNLLTLENTYELMVKIKSIIDGHVGDIADEYPADQEVIDELYKWMDEYEQKIRKDLLNEWGR